MSRKSSGGAFESKRGGIADIQLEDHVTLALQRKRLLQHGATHVVGDARELL